MKSGDEVKISSSEEIRKGKIIRFYANQGTALVQLECGKLTYCSYESIETK